jgi:hypothetical protein
MEECALMRHVFVLPYSPPMLTLGFVTLNVFCQYAEYETHKTFFCICIPISKSISPYAYWLLVFLLLLGELLLPFVTYSQL